MCALVTGDIAPSSVVAGGAALNEYGTTIALSSEQIYLHSRQAVFRGPSNFVFSWTSGNGYAAPDIGFSRVAPGVLALGNSVLGDTSGSLTLGSLTASGTVTGNRVSRTIAANAVAVVSASGSTPADEVFLCEQTSAITLTIPPLGLAPNTSRPFTVADVLGRAASNPVTITVADTGTTTTLTTNDGIVTLLVSSDASGNKYLSVK